MKKEKLIISSFIYLSPVLVFAQERIGSLQEFLSVSSNLINWIIFTIIIPLSLVFFLWGLFRFIYNGQSEDGRKEGKQRMIWGIIALTVMLGVWGFVKILQTAILGDSFIDQPPF